MTYAVGSTIEASTYNVFANSVSKIMGLGTGDFGYGILSKSLSDVIAGSTIRASSWENLRNNINDFNVHQDTSAIDVASAAIPPSADFEVGDLIIAYDGSSGRWNLAANASANACNRLNAAASQVNLGEVLLDSRNTSWVTAVQHIFTATFSDTDAARHFFNSGGEIQIAAALVGTSNLKNDDWRDLFVRASTYVFDASVYFNPNASTTNIQRLQVTSSVVAYTANDYTILERRDAVEGTRGSEGRIITFTVQFNDDAVGNVDEPVTGSLSSIIDRRVSTGVISGSAPTFNTTTSVTAGS